jgi:hypothetical protein
MAVVAHPHQIVETIVRAVLVEVVDGQQARIGVPAPRTDRHGTRSKENLSVRAFALLPVGVFIACSQGVGPRDSATVVAEEELASRLPDVGETAVELFPAVMALLDLAPDLGPVQALLGTVDRPSSPYSRRLGIELLATDGALPGVTLSSSSITAIRRTILAATVQKLGGRRVEFSPAYLTVDTWHPCHPAFRPRNRLYLASKPSTGKGEGERGESNPRPLGPQPSALAAELRPPNRRLSSLHDYTTPTPHRKAPPRPLIPAADRPYGTGTDFSPAIVCQVSVPPPETACVKLNVIRAGLASGSAPAG